MPALDHLEELGCEHVSAAVLGPSGLLEHHGDIDRPYRLASVTKLLTAYAVLVGLEEAVVSLEDTAGPPGSTLRHLLSHTSGLSMDSARMQLARPGERRIYSNVGIEAAASHLQSASQMAFSSYLDEAVLVPLEMASTSLEGGSPAHGATSTVSDLSHFVAEWFAPRLIATTSLSQATSVHFPGTAGVLPGFGRQDPCDFGLGFELRGHKAPHWTAESNSDRTFGHFGQSGTFVWLDPAAQLATVFLSDRPFGEWAKKAWPRLSARVLSCHLAASEQAP